MIGHIGDLVLSNQVSSFSTAFLTIFAVIFLFVRSLPLGLLGMIPNVFPVLAILGLMGWVGIDLDVATAMIASIVLGVSVDDTMYFLQNYAEARGRGATVRDAVTHTIAVAGKPALFCAALLALGFFVLGLSSFRSLAVFGLLSGSAVLLAAGTELLLLPALLALGFGRER
jgi:predicted RND superfamily exporter protein